MRRSLLTTGSAGSGGASGSRVGEGGGWFPLSKTGLPIGSSFPMAVPGSGGGAGGGGRMSERHGNGGGSSGGSGGGGGSSAGCL